MGTKGVSAITGAVLVAIPIAIEVGNGFSGKVKGARFPSKPLVILAGDLGLEPRAFGFGGQRSIHLS